MNYMPANFSKYFKNICLSFLLVALPTDGSYILKSYEFGTAGNGSDGNVSIEATGSDLQGVQKDGTYKLDIGFIYTQQADTPLAPTFSNDANWYNKLKVVINPSDNPSDAVFAIMVSDDGFNTTKYVQSDMTVGLSLGTEDYMTYSSWGGASGSMIIGLNSSTSYSIKVRARQGVFTESPWSPISSASTSALSLSFDIDIGDESFTSGESASPYLVQIGELSRQTYTVANDRVWVDLETNADSGGVVYVYSTGSGLSSSYAGHAITSMTEDLSLSGEGYGIAVDSVTQSQSGPLVAVSPYNVSDGWVGSVSSVVREIFMTSYEPIVGGRGSVAIKGRRSAVTPSASDYTSTLVFIASSTF